MKIFLSLILLLTSGVLCAHEGHMLEDGNLHTAYHLIIWSLFAFVAFKGIQLLVSIRNKHNKK